MMMNNNATSAARWNRLLVIGTFLLLYIPVPVSAQSVPIASSGLAKSGITLSFKVEGLQYNKASTIKVRFSVKNNRREAIFLIIQEEAVPRFDPNKRQLIIFSGKRILTYHEFSLPELKRIKPGEKYQGETSLSLSTVKNDLDAGTWLLYISLGYLESHDMSEIHNDLKQYPLAALGRIFQESQKELSAGPIEFELLE